MSAARSQSSRLSRRLARAERIAAVMRRSDATFGPLAVVRRVVPDAEALYFAIRPNTLRAPDRFVGGDMVSFDETMRMRRRAYALRVWLARRLARQAAHPGLVATWLGCAREDLYQWRRLRAGFGR